MNFTIRRFAEPICRSSYRRPIVWFLVTLIISIPALVEFRNIGLDTNLVRLLPSKSPAARWTRTLQQAVSDEGYFTIVFEGPRQEKILSAVQETAERVRRMKGVLSAEYEYPLDFIHHYRYLLVPNYYLEKILDYLISLEAELSPVGSDLLSEETGKSAKAKKEDEEMKRLLNQYSRLTPYHQSQDGRVMGLFIRPQIGLTSLGELRTLWLELEREAARAAREHALWTGVGGSQIENLKEYDVIVSDLRISGTIATFLILLALVLSFRSVLILPALLYPLAIGLLWSFSLVPPFLSNLNIITSFLILVLFGMGIDFSIHIVRRFQLELALKSPEDALIETYVSTGTSVMISGLNTALALLVLAFSDFKGFSEYGLICGGAIALTLVAMFVVMPAVLVLGHRIRWIKPLPAETRKGRVPPRLFGYLTGGFLVASLAVAVIGLRFDYDFNTLKPEVPASRTFEKRSGEVYAHYMSPGAVYVAPDLAKLDELLAVLWTETAKPRSLIQRISSIRDFAPNDELTAERLELISQIKDQVQGNWTQRIEDPEVRRWIEDIRSWTPPDRQPNLDEVPAVLRAAFETRDGSGQFLVGVYPNIPRGNGKNAMKFTRELYSLALPVDTKGPVGEMPVFAEILWIIASEAPWVVAATFFSVILLVFIGNRSLKETGWTIFPLISGLILTFGVMAVARFRLNYFNVVVIPTLIGLGEDNGVHYYRRWKEIRRDTLATHRELWAPLSMCTLTTMMGYSGMLFASHPGLRSIGFFACLGMACIWLTSLVLFPTMLEAQRSHLSPPRADS